MCEVNGKLSIIYEEDGYMKLRIGHHGAYVPRNGGARMRQQVRDNEGRIIFGSTLRGMLVRIYGEGQSTRDGWWWK